MEWINYVTVPKIDGTYEMRLCELDDEITIVKVANGKAYWPDGNQRLFINCQWRKIST